MPTPLAIALTVLGAAFVVLAFSDAAVAVLHPSRRGWLSRQANRVVWVVVGALVRTRRPHLMRLAGPFALGANFLVWLGGLGIGFTLIYWAWVGSLGFDGPGPPPDGLMRALYLSGASLSTVGFGDVVATSDVLRLVTIAEGAAGLTAFTATITYLLSVYSVVSDLRSAAAHANDLGAGDPERATALLVHGGAGEVARLQRELIVNQQHLRRFPVLFYFHPPRSEESLYTLLRGAFVVHLVLRFGVDRARLPFAADYGRAFGMTLERVMTDLRADFVGGPDAPEPIDAGPLDEDEAAARLEALRAAVAEVDPDLAAPPADGDGVQFARAAGAADAFLRTLAAAHAYPHAPVVPTHPGERWSAGAVRLAAER